MSKVGLALLFLMSCAACSPTSYVTVPEVVTIRPPMHLMQPTPEPTCALAVNADLVTCVADYRDALRKANADKVAMQQSVGVN